MWPFKKKQPVFCKDCVRFCGGKYGPICQRKKITSLITGEQEVMPTGCCSERAIGDCGPSGKYFKRKEEAV